MRLDDLIDNCSLPILPHHGLDILHHHFVDFVFVCKRSFARCFPLLLLLDCCREKFEDWVQLVVLTSQTYAEPSEYIDHGITRIVFGGTTTCAIWSIPTSFQESLLVRKCSEHPALPARRLFELATVVVRVPGTAVRE